MHRIGVHRPDRTSSVTVTKRRDHTHLFFEPDLFNEKTDRSKKSVVEDKTLIHIRKRQLRSTLIVRFVGKSFEFDHPEILPSYFRRTHIQRGYLNHPCLGFPK